MEDHFTIALINHSFQINYFSRRWELFAEDHPNVEVFLVAPKEYEWYAGKRYSYAGSITHTSKEIDKGNFHRRLVDMQTRPGWESDDYKPLFDKIKPDIIYLIGTNRSALYQLLKLREKFYPNTKVINFSMRGPAQNLRLDVENCGFFRKVWRVYQYHKAKKRLAYYNSHLDAVFCHYPEAIKCYRKEGFYGPIYMQTQVGVNPEWFHPDDNARKEIREKYNISDDTYLFGSASRFAPSKGLSDIVNALPTERDDWKFLMMGTGNDEEVKYLSDLIKSRGLEDRVILPGMIDWYEIAKYWNAIDCAVHVPRTTLRWVETFSLSAVQPQATMKPVIGNTSGSVPYQLGFDEMIVPEGDLKSLKEKILWVLSHRDEARIVGEKMFRRTIDSFSIKHLNDMFYETLVEDVLQGQYDIKKIDMTQYTPKNHEEK